MEARAAGVAARAARARHGGVITGGTDHAARPAVHDVGLHVDAGGAAAGLPREGAPT